MFCQVFGRYVLNSSPTWAESLALVLILYVTLIGAAVGVRDAGHIGMDSLLILAAGRLRAKSSSRSTSGPLFGVPWPGTAGCWASR